MEPDEFLDQEAFDALTEQERAAYLARLVLALQPVFAREEAEERTLEFIKHYFDVMQWILPPDEYEKAVREPMWDAAWGEADQIVATLERAASSPDLTEEDRAEAVERLEQARAIAEHRRALEDAPEVD